KLGVAAAAEIDAATRSMTRLNAAAAAIARAHPVSAATDVTGFGLVGHLRNVLRGSDLAARLDLGRLPLLPGALDHAAAGRLPGGSCANRDFLAPWIRGREAADPLRL